MGKHFGWVGVSGGGWGWVVVGAMFDHAQLNPVIKLLQQKTIFYMQCDVLWKDSTSFPEMFYLIDFIDTAHTACNFLKRAKLMSPLF